MTDFPVTVDLPKGAWARLRDPEDVPERLRRPILRAQMSMAGNADTLNAAQQAAERAAAGEGDPAEQAGLVAQLIRSGVMDLVSEVSDVAIVAMVEAWSYDMPITVDTVLDIPGVAYRIIQDAIQPHLATLTPEFSPNADPESPTPPSSG